MIRNSVVTSLAILQAIAFGVALAKAQTESDANAPRDTAQALEANRTPHPASRFAGRIEEELGVAGGLTSEQVAEKTVLTSYGLEARRAEVAAASAEVNRALSAYFPRLVVLGRYTRLSELEAGSAGSLVIAPGVPNGPIPPGSPLLSVPLTFDSPLDNYLLQASLTIPVSDYFLRVSKAHDSAKASRGASLAELESSRNATIADAKLTYYAWVRARLNRIVAQQALEDAHAHLTDVQSALGAGTASQADLLSIQARVADSERLADSASHLVTELEEQLRILRHDPPITNYAIGETLAPEPATNVSGAPSDLVRIALSRRSELQTLRLRAVSLERRASAESAGRAPRLDLFGNAQYENPSRRVIPQRDEFTGSWDAGVQISWVLSDIPASGAASKSLMESATALRAELRATEDRIRREVSAAHTALLDGRAATRTTIQSLAAAEEAYRVRRVLFQNGRATSVELLDAELDLTRARLLAVNARIDLRVARVRLDYAVGQGAPAPASDG